MSTTPTPTHDDLRLLLSNMTCGTCQRPYTLAEVARRAKVNYYTLHKFVSRQHKTMEQETLDKLRAWLLEEGEEVP